MPIIKVTTKNSKKTWSSPDGQKSIYEVDFDFNGRTFKAKTYSEVISVPAWSGEIETYEKPGKYGVQTFVKQPTKENAPQQKTSYPRTSKQQPQNNPFTMYLSYSKDLVVAMLQTTGEVNKDEFKKLLKATLEGGKVLYQADPNSTPVLGTKSDGEEDIKEIVNQVFPDDDNFIVDGEPDDAISLEELEEAIGDGDNE